MTPHNLPDYVEVGGRQVWRPPYAAESAEVFGFVLDCDRVAIDELLLRDLVEPAVGAVDYRAAADSLVVLFTAIDRLVSREDPDRLRGYVRELEASIWCLAADVLEGGRLVWYLPYVFTDAGQAIASGREVYGYPKQAGSFGPGFLDALSNGGIAAVEAPAIDPFGPNQPATPRPMLTAERLAASGAASPVVDAGASAFASLQGLLGDVVGIFDVPHGPPPPVSAAITPAGAPPPAKPVPIQPPAIARRVINRITGRSLKGSPDELVAEMVTNPTLVFLKQFRDATCPTKACYQAIVEAPLAVHATGASYEQLDPSLFTVTVEDWASHPVATDVGLAAATPLVPTHAFRAEFDFEILLGLEVWRAPT